MPEWAVPGRPRSVATAWAATPSAGECGVKDQVSRSGPSTVPVGRHAALVGPTASGKTAVAVAVARALGDVELVSVDAMAVYRGLDIGTAKPTGEQRAGLAWHLVDLVDPEEAFSVADFQAAAHAALQGIEARGNRALLVGGTGLYQRAVVDRLTFPPRYPEVAAELEAQADEPGGVERLHGRLVELDPVAASRMEPTNRRRVVRALEVTLGSGRPFSASGPGLAEYRPTPFTLIGLTLARDELARRIEARLDAQLAAGFLDETRALAARPEGLSRTAAQALGYRELLAHLAGACTLEEARERAVRRTRTFARRQESWFRRDPRVRWLDAGRGRPCRCGRPAARLERRVAGGPRGD